MRVIATVTGFREFEDLLKQLPKRVARKVMAGALRKAAAPIRDSARANVPVETGEMRKSIKIYAGKTRRKGRTAVFIGIVGKKGPLAHLVEYGSKAHLITSKSKRTLADASTGHFFGKTVKHPGTPSRPFMRPALDTNADKAISIMKVEIGNGIIREAELLVKAGRVINGG